MKNKKIIPIIVVLILLTPIIAFGVQEFLANIIVDDNLSGVDKIILPDGTEIKNNKAIFNVTEIGTYTFEAFDKAGNKAEKTIEIKSIDRPVPEITISKYNSSWTNQNITVTASTDIGTLNQDSYTFTENGTFEFIANNQWGNTDKVKVTIVNIDKEKPLLELIPDIKDKTYRVNINVKTKDDLSGIAKIILPDGTEIKKDNTTFEVVENGIYIFKTFDKAGNKTKKTIEINNIDKKIINEIDDKINNLPKLNENTNLEALKEKIKEIEDEINRLPDGKEKEDLLDKLEKIKNQTESESFKTNEEENKVSINPPKENEVKEIKKKNNKKEETQSKEKINPNDSDISISKTDAEIKSKILSTINSLPKITEETNLEEIKTIIEQLKKEINKITTLENKEEIEALIAKYEELLLEEEAIRKEKETIKKETTKKDKNYGWIFIIFTLITLIPILLTLIIKRKKR